jgi:hypothetical protein
MDTYVCTYAHTRVLNKIKSDRIFPRADHKVCHAHYLADSTAAIQERVTAVLWSFPKEAFADSFQKLYERCQPCVVKDGDCFEGQ